MLTRVLVDNLVYDIHVLSELDVLVGPLAGFKDRLRQFLFVFCTHITVLELKLVKV